MSLVISTFGDDLKHELPACLPILVDRMGNEITRLTAVKVNSLSTLVVYVHCLGAGYLLPLECLAMNKTMKDILQGENLAKESDCCKLWNRSKLRCLM